MLVRFPDRPVCCHWTDLGRAWAIKESLRRLWHYVYPASGWKFWKRWYFWATHSRLEPIRKAAETVRRHIDNILAYYQHPVTNAMSEGLNSKIQKIRSMEDKALYWVFNRIHVYTSYFFAALIAIHVAAALKHLLVNRDQVFQRMLPGKPRS